MWILLCSQVGGQRLSPLLEAPCPCPHPELGRRGASALRLCGTSALSASLRTGREQELFPGAEGCGGGASAPGDGQVPALAQPVNHMHRPEKKSLAYLLSPEVLGTRVTYGNRQRCRKAPVSPGHTITIVSPGEVSMSTTLQKSGSCRLRVPRLLGKRSVLFTFPSTHFLETLLGVPE